VPAGANNRSQRRSNVFLSAALLTGGAQLPVRVRNLSSRGALLEGSHLPPAGIPVRLIRGKLSAEGELAWQMPGHAGVRFARDIDVGAWVKRVEHEGQQRIDRAIAVLRRQQPRSASEDSPAPPSVARASKELQEICGRLAASPSITGELWEELMRLDAVARTLQQLAAD
jgi:hypothetical protein